MRLYNKIPSLPDDEPPSEQQQPIEEPQSEIEPHSGVELQSEQIPSVSSGEAKDPDAVPGYTSTFRCKVFVVIDYILSLSLMLITVYVPAIYTKSAWCETVSSILVDLFNALQINIVLGLLLWVLLMIFKLAILKGHIGTVKNKEVQILLEDGFYCLVGIILATFLIKGQPPWAACS